MSNSRVAYLRPSGAATWTVCSGYPAMAAAYPEIPDEADNEVREDGIACHWLAVELWYGRTPDEGSLSPNGRVLTDEMFDAAELYLSFLRSNADAEWYLERTQNCSFVYPGMEGTPDAFSYIPGVLKVADLKFGFRFVEVWDNLQLIIYALAILRALGITADVMVELTIVQPRNYHREGQVRTWCISRTALEQRFLQFLRAKAIEAMNPEAVCTPNPGCVDCPGRHACEALQQAGYIAAEQSYSSIPLELPPAAIGGELTRLKAAAKFMEARISGLEAQAETLIRNGSVIPGWQVAATYSNERLIEGAESQLMTLAHAYFGGVTITKPPKLLTPNQLRKVLPKTIVDMFVHRTTTGVKLVKQDKLAGRKAFQGE